MQYVLIDAHQRFLGTLKSEKALAVGDTFENTNAQSYTVIGLNWFKQDPRTQSLTVIPMQPAVKAAT
ncbi:MAG: hypothetical protein MUF49_28880 [Oculatellaceae cyanobacterium Prado106]|jgi:hypothetical protein|nr:hypothetical protein [Oculatellaceae cyanobacterium Prado106]